MRRLNLVEKCAARLEPSAPRPFHEVAFDRLRQPQSTRRRVFLDPGTLAAFAAESDRETAHLSEGLEPAFPPPRAAGPSAICLSVTHACDLACRYCYVRTNPRRPATMRPETARSALGLLSPPGPWRVGFFGGEPMLAWDLVCRVTELARERALQVNQGEGARVRFSLTTNGTLVTAKRAEFLARHGFSLIVSLDGPRDLHDEERRRPDGAGSFDRVVDGLRILAAAGLGRRTTLRATFPLARPDIARRLEFLNSLAEEGLARAVSVEPAWPIRQPQRSRIATEFTEITEKPGRRAERQTEAEPLRSVTSVPSVAGRSRSAFSAADVLAEEYLAAARWAASRIESGKPVLFHHLQKALERILLMKPAGSECGAGSGYLEVAPSGEIHACHKAVGGAIGHVERGISERLRAPWLDNRWYARRACRSCWARNVCGGGCRAVALEHTGSVTKAWPLACAVKKAQVRAALCVAAVCSRERLAGFLEPRIGGRSPPRRQVGQGREEG